MKYNQALGIIVFFVLFFSNNIQAQYTTSPYSMFGIGEIDSRTYELNGGMAGTGIGLRLRNFMNSSNPAALSIDSLAFIFDISTGAKLSQYSYQSNTNNAVGMNLKKFALGFRIFPKWAISLGIRPYSNVGYKMMTTSAIEGTNDTYLTEFEGSGGLSRVYITNSYRLTNNLSIGVNASLLFGTINQTETQYGTHTGITGEFIIDKSSYTRKINFDFGAQYANQINNSLFYTLGAIYGYKTNISLTNNIKVSNSFGYLLEEKTTRPSKTSIPQYIGGGGSLSFSSGSSQTTLAADYIFENWGAIKSPSTNAHYTNSHKVSVGALYLPNVRLPRNYFQRMHYQMGASYQLSNMLIDGEKTREYALSLGLNFPISRSLLHFSTDIGYREGKNLMSEKYVKFTLGVTLNEIWFLKRFYY